ncbi:MULTISPECIES: AraC family transcriptional regulator [unclassified Paenibacillus]|uniref:AraC family transcriptional regulator n=1 Tax=unclassified Paenibacillus TaxID=185978 RepID=UPI001376E50E
MLETTTLSVEEVGRRSGFPNVSYFIQLFRKTAGTTPLQYGCILNAAADIKSHKVNC